MSKRVLSRIGDTTDVSAGRRLLAPHKPGVRRRRNDDVAPIPQRTPRTVHAAAWTRRGRCALGDGVSSTTRDGYHRCFVAERVQEMQCR